MKQLGKAARALALAMTVTAAAGCATIKTIEEAGAQAAEGDIFSAAYLATIGASVALIYDVVTLGGALSGDKVAAGLSAATEVASAAGASRQNVRAPSSASTSAPAASMTVPASAPLVISAPTQTVSVGSRDSANGEAPTDNCPAWGPSYAQKLARVACTCKGPGFSFTQSSSGFTCKNRGVVSIGCSKASNSCVQS
jgi:hypothetical protein